MATITLPYKYKPRFYQVPLLRAFDEGIKRGVAVWHRRAGKDKTALNLMVKKTQERKGIYFYFLPTYNQAEKIIWDGIDKSGFKFLDHFPDEIIAKKNKSSMKLELRNGSIFQLVGTDNIDRVVGTNPIGCVFSEYALQNPKAWDFIRPILLENDGWALFIYTPRGQNHGHDMYQIAERSEDWFAEMLTIEDTGIISPEEVEREVEQGMDEETAQQEYYCSFAGSRKGAYFASQLKRAEDEGRVTLVPYDPGLEVTTAWDLGMDDSTFIWFIQEHGQEIRLIDCLENSGEGLKYYIAKLREKTEEIGYQYDRHYAPFDINVKELGTGKSRLETAKEYGLRFTVSPKLSVYDGINAIRKIFNRIWIDKKAAKRGLNALRNYRKEYNDDKKVFKQKPLHDWSSHGADALRTYAVARRDNKIKTGQSTPEGEFDQTELFPSL